MNSLVTTMCLALALSWVLGGLKLAFYLGGSRLGRRKGRGRRERQGRWVVQQNWKGLSLFGVPGLASLRRCCLG